MSTEVRRRRIVSTVLAAAILICAATCAIGVGSLKSADGNIKRVAPSGDFAAVYGIDMSSLQVWTQNSSIALLNDYEPDASIMDGRIAPGVGGTSFFKLTNTNYFPVKVTIKISEDGGIHLPMRYRLLKCNSSGTVTGEMTSWQYSTIRENAVVLKAPGIELAANNSTTIVALEWQWLYESYVCMYPYGSYEIGDIISVTDYNTLTVESRGYFGLGDETDTAGGMLNDNYTVMVSVIAEQTL